MSSRGPMLMHEPSVVEVNLSAIDQNMAAIRRLVGPECRLCPIVKADAYGLGAARVARRLAQAGAEMIAVYSLPQAAELGLGFMSPGSAGPGPNGFGSGTGSGPEGAPADIGVPVLVLMPIIEMRGSDETARMLRRGRLHLTVHDGRQLAALESLAEEFDLRIPVHVEVDTGMSRGGAAPEDAVKLIERVASGRRCELRGVFTHFANSRVDRAATDAQAALFDDVLRRSAAHLGPECMIHVASSYALLRSQRYHRTMVRFGLAWAGYGLEELEGAELELPSDLLRPCLRWRSRVVQVKHVPTGTAVGYGSTWTAKRPSAIGLVPVGYADGFPVARSRGSDEVPQRIALLRETPRGIEREYASVVGVVNMDQITIDLTDIDLLGQPNQGVGMTVELVTPDPAAPNHLPRLAARSGMIPHEMLCRIHSRIPRLYVVEGMLEATEPQVSEAVASRGAGRAAAG